jgi:hypothetical protein
MNWLFVFLVLYIVLGLIAAFFLKQTPYAENPLWTMILLWPLYLFG